MMSRNSTPSVRAYGAAVNTSSAAVMSQSKHGLGGASATGASGGLGCCRGPLCGAEATNSCSSNSPVVVAHCRGGCQQPSVGSADPHTGSGEPLTMQTPFTPFVGWTRLAGNIRVQVSVISTGSPSRLRRTQRDC